MNKLVNILVVIIAIGSSATFAQFPDLNVRFRSSINTAYTGKCIDVAGGAMTAGTFIVQYTCQNSTNQNFQLRTTGDGLYQIRPVLSSNLCVSTPGDTYATTSDQLRLRTCTAMWTGQPDAAGTYWYLRYSTSTFRYIFVSALPSPTGAGMCIDVPGGAATNSLILQVYPCGSQSLNQQWFKSDGS